MVLVKQGRTTRDFLGVSFVPVGKGWRRAGSGSSWPKARAGLSATATTRLHFPKPGRAGFWVSGPFGVRSIGPGVAAILLSLCGRRKAGCVEYLALSEAVWPNADDMPDGWKDVLRVQISNLRRALREIGSEIQIVAVFGVGVAVHRPGAARNDNALMVQKRVG